LRQSPYSIVNGEREWLPHGGWMKRDRVLFYTI